MSFKEKSIIPLLSRFSKLWLNNKKVNGLIILAYHRVFEKEDNFIFDDGVMSCSPEEFEDQMKFCKENFNIINFSLLNRHFEKRETLQKNSLIITFDDGYRDNYTNALPILKKYNIPATIFLAVKNIETGENFWWDKVSYYMKSQGKQEPDIKNLLRSLKLCSNNERIEVIESIRKSSKILSRTIERQVLTWEEIKEMSHKGIEFGSHTMTHPILSRLEDKNEIVYELKQSKKIIEDKLQKEVVVFSYPVGREDSFNQGVKDILNEAGYSFAVNYIHGVNYINNRFDRFSLKRFDIDQISLERFKAKLAFPKLFKR